RSSAGRATRPYQATVSGGPHQVVRGLEHGRGEVALEHGQRPLLELAGALAAHAQLLADLLERRGLALEAEAELDDAPLALGQVGEGTLDGLAAEHLCHFLDWVGRRRVGEQ